MKNYLVLFLMLIIVFQGVAQKQKQEEVDEYDENFEFSETKEFNINVGVGLGIDYGGIGLKLGFTPTPAVSVFGSIGFNLVGAGYNGGIVFRVLPDKVVSPYLTGMYGYNAVIYVDGLPESTKTYYGPSFGGGIEFKRKRGKFWNFGLLIPVRSSDYRADVDALKIDPRIEEFTEPLPIAITVGFHFPL